MTPSLQIRTGALVIAVIVAAAPRPTDAASVSTILQLVPATATENTFAITVDVLGLQDTQTVFYTGVLRPAMEIDFTNVAAPVVQSLDFDGLDGDVQHTDATFSVFLGTAAFRGIMGRVKTLSDVSPASVVGGTTFNSNDHQLIAWRGVIDIAPIIGEPTAIDLFQSPFSGTLVGASNSTIHVALNNIAGGTATYDVEVTAELGGVRILTGKSDVDSLISIFIEGNIVAAGQFTRPVPEPATSVVGVALAALAASYRRRQR